MWSPMMRKFSGRLREVVAYMNFKSQGVSSKKRSGLIYFMEENFFASKQLRYAILCSH